MFCVLAQLVSLWYIIDFRVFFLHCGGCSVDCGIVGVLVLFMLFAWYCGCLVVVCAFCNVVDGVVLPFASWSGWMVC